MFKNDCCLELVNSSALAEMASNQEMISGLMEVLSLTAETSQERILNAVKDELIDLSTSMEREISALRQEGKGSVEADAVIDGLRTSLCRFPRDELKQLLGQLRDSHASSSLIPILHRYIERHSDLERRLGWLMRPLTSEETSHLDPVRNCDEIYHSMSYEFRAEMKVFSILYELRAVIVASSTSLLLTTGEFTHRSVQRLVDTVLLFANVLEWGLDSYRGRICIQRINEIHSRYAIPNEAFLFILSGLMFVPEDWNRKFGWRPFTETEKLGWFHAIAKVGRAMNIQEIKDDYEEMKSWYEVYCGQHAYPAEVKRRLFDQIIGQVLSTYPEKARPLLLSAILAGMDDVYRAATGYPEPPLGVQQAVKSAFFCLGHLGVSLPRIPWFRTLQSNKVYPHGYKVEELGSQNRSMKRPIPRELPLISLEEVERHNRKDDLWVVIEGRVYDLTRFAKNHPGGREILAEYAGKDASEGFARVKHSAEARSYMSNYIIGTLDIRLVDTDVPGCPFSCFPRSGKETRGEDGKRANKAKS